MNKYVQLYEALIQYMDAKTVTLHPLVQVWSNIKNKKSGQDVECKNLIFSIVLYGNV